MFIRLKKRILREGNGDTRDQPGRFSYDAVLVKSVRTEMGPRQRSVKHLGTIRSDWLDHRGAVVTFRQQVAKNLSELGIDPSDDLLEPVLAKIRFPTVRQEKIRAARGRQAALKRAAEIRTLAERQMGAFLKQMPKNQGALPGKTGTKAAPVLDPTPTLAEVGITKKQSTTAQKLADSPKTTQPPPGSPC